MRVPRDCTHRTDDLKNHIAGLRGAAPGETKVVACTCVRYINT